MTVLKLLIELILYCLLFFLLLKVTVKNDGRNMLYFYPADYQKKAVEIGLADEKELKRKKNEFMAPFVLILLAVLVFMIAYCNHVTGFKYAYLQSLLFLEVMNWFDGWLDRAWIGHSKIWKIPEMDDFPYVSSWRAVLRKRLIGTALFAVVAFPLAGLVILVSKVI